MTTTLKQNVGLIGLGYWGKNILRNLYSIGVLNTACDSDEKVITERKQDYQDIRYCTSVDEIIKDSEIEAVVVATPAATHYRIVKESLLSGKDVLVEKPLSLTLSEGKELVEIAERGKRILMVGHILQFHPAVDKLKEIITSGDLGRIEYIYSNRLNIGKLRTEENILWSFAPHDISVILMLLDEEPAGIKAFGGDYVNNGIYDTTMTMFEFKNGVKGHIFVSWLHPYKEQKLVVVGSKAMAVFDDLSKEKLFIYPHRIEWRNGKIPVAMKADYNVLPVGDAEPLRQELNHFIECITLRQRPRTDGHEGLRVLRVLEIAEKTMVDGKRALNTIIPPDTSGIKPDISPSAYIHESSYVDVGAKIGDGVKIWHFSHVLRGSVIGDNCVIGQNAVIGPDVMVGNGCKIQNNVSIYKGVTLEDEVFCGPSCVFTNVYNPRAFIERKHEFRNTLVKKGATIGANATIVCGVTIGRYAVIAAGAVVKSDVSDHAIVAGVPSRVIGWACKCGTTLTFNGKKAACVNCGNEYELDGDNLLIAVS